MNEHWEIEPNISVGPLLLGMRKEECEAVLGGAHDVFKRTGDSIKTIMVYESENLHITINEKGKAEEYSLFSPRKIMLKGVQVLGRSPEDVYSELVSTGIRLEKSDIGMWSEKIGVNLVEVEGIIDGVEIRSSEQA